MIDAMDSVKQEQIAILATHRSAIALGTVCAGILTLVVLWEAYSADGLLLWFTLFVLLAAYRWYLSACVQQKSHVSKLQLFMLTASAYANGVIWGSIFFVFFPQEPLTLALVFGLHASYVSAAAASTSIYLPVFFGFVVTSTALVCIGLIMAGLETYWPFAALMHLYLVISILLGLKNNRAFTEQIKLRFENTALMAELVDQRDRAETAMRAKNSFLAAASHDLRQPVHALGLFVDSLESYQESEAALRILDKIRQATGSLGSLFHGLLEISRLDAGIIENKPEEFELDYLLEGVLSEFQGLAVEKNLALNFPLNTGMIVKVDPGLLERIIRNLISNAIKYTSIGEVNLRIARVRGNGVRLDVVDSGRGIPESELENIFSEYHQLENPERDRQKGIGLGLAIVRRLCNIMEIPITVQSELGKGSTFSVVLPESDGYKLSRRSSHEYADQDLNGRRIIVVDDELPILEGMYEVLSSWGCSVITADSPRLAMEKVNVFGLPDLVIADLRLRNNESGVDLIRSIRDKYLQEIPAILVTGDTAVEQLQQTLSATVKVLHKPVSPEKLRSAIVEQTGSSESAR